MNKSPLVSVILPVFNEEKYLKKCLTSIFQQSYPPLEVIVIDDGSSDKSTQVAQAFPIKLIRQNHRGPGSARNTGVKHARGEIICFLDADMTYDQYYIENLTNPIRLGKAKGTFNKEEFVANPDNIWSECWSINSNLPKNRRLPANYKETENAFRAIKKTYALKGFNENEGYTDDSSLSTKTNLLAMNAPGAISYHYNPSSIGEVFYSARWIGRSKLYEKSINNLFRFSVINSLRIACKYILKGAPLAIIPFKLVYDSGVFIGIFLSGKKTAK